MKIIGITGGSGAGKSFVAGVWERLGARLINADVIYHGLLCENSDMLSEIARRFPSVIRSDGVYRPALREIVFSDADALADLNQITHKYVIEKIMQELERARRDGVEVAVVEALYLVENDLSQTCDITVAVVAPVGVRMRRVTARDGLTDEEAWNRLRSQQSDEYYFNSCDKVIENSGSTAELKSKAEYIYNNINK